MNTTTITEQENSIRKELRQLRSKVIECEDKNTIADIHSAIDKLKQELFALTEKSVDKFTISFKKKPNGDYFVSAKYLYEEIQSIIHKTDGLYWSSSISGKFKYLKDIKRDLTQQLKNELYK